MNFEIGDSFNIVDRETFKYNCKDQRDFIIKRFSVSGLSAYYDDNRTNKKCRCSACEGSEVEKCVGLYHMELVSKRLQRDRDLKLKLLGI